MDYSYQRNFVNGRYDLDSEYLGKKIKSDMSLGCRISCNLTSCVISFSEELEDQTVLDDLVEESRTGSLLSVLKEDKINAVRFKTEAEEALGVPYNNYQFSVSPSAKSNWLAVVISSAGLTYPFSAPTGFNSIYEFQNQGDVQAFFGASMFFLKYWEESNESLIIAINACETCEAVNAIVDDRTYPPA